MPEHWAPIFWSFRPLEERRGNRRQRASTPSHRQHSALLLIAMAALLSYCGWIIAEWDGILWSLVGGAVMLVLAGSAGARSHGDRCTPGGAGKRRCSMRLLMRSAAAPVSIMFPIFAGSVSGSQSPSRSGPVSQPRLHCRRANPRNDGPRDPRDPRARDRPLRNGDLALLQLAMVVGRLTRTVSQIAFLLVFFSPSSSSVSERCCHSSRSLTQRDLALFDFADSPRKAGGQCLGTGSRHMLRLPRQSNVRWRVACWWTWN